MATASTDLQEGLDRLTNYRNEDLEEVKVRGARTAFNKKFKRRSKIEVTELYLDPPTEVKNKLYHVLDQWAKGKVRKVWMSENLPQHFNLPVMTSPPDCWLFQALCLGQDLEFVLLTLYSGTSVAREPDTAQIRNFSMKCARMLTSSLLNVYHRDFILLPCTVHYKHSFDSETLQKEVEEQLDYAADFYGGPEKLRGVAFDEMVRAMSMVASSTSVPSLLFDQDRKGKEWLLVMDTDLDTSVRRLITNLTGNKHFAISYSRDAEQKVKIAVIEAARRLIYSRTVVIVTNDSNIQHCVQKLTKEAEQAHGLDPERFQAVSPDDIIPESYCVIAIDVTGFQCAGLKLSVSKQSDAVVTTTPNNNSPEHFRVLLVGKSGSGKSSTGNTLLGQDVFPTSAAFSRVTNTSTTGVSTHRGVTLEVVDSPGILGMRREFQSECTHTTLLHLLETDSVRTFHAVCYVIKIDRFTEEEFNVFKRLREILGQNVTQHMIIIVTHGDSFERGNIEHIVNNGPKRLTDVLNQCGNRYVVFDNTATKDKSQVDRFLDILRKMNCDAHGNRKPYLSPKNGEIETRWEDARTVEKAERKQSLLAAG